MSPAGAAADDMPAQVNVDERGRGPPLITLAAGAADAGDASIQAGLSSLQIDPPVVSPPLASTLDGAAGREYAQSESPIDAPDAIFPTALLGGGALVATLAFLACLALARLRRQR